MHCSGSPLMRFLAPIVLLASGAAANAQEPVKIGVITTLSGGGAVLGLEIKKGVELAVDKLGKRIGNAPVELTIIDDQMKPEIGREAAVQLVRKNKVNFVVGMVWSNVVLAAVPYLVREKVITVGTVGGPADLAGKSCSKYVFVMSNQTDQGGEAMGKYLQDTGVKDVALMAPNYAGGHSTLTGFKRYFKGQIRSETYTQVGQPDYQAELSQLRAQAPSAIVAFYPGSMGIQFVQQYEQAGMRGKIPFYGLFVSDVLTLKAQRSAALGNYDVGYWNADLPNERNKAFVADFQNAFKSLPSLYSSISYDAIMMIADAVVANKNNLADKDALIGSMEKWTNSVRGSFAFNTNHFPIQDYLLLQVEETSPGEFGTRTAAVAFKDQKDSYYQDCHMER
jgi:branched-chain amino acid transport system substrate-binding protein